MRMATNQEGEQRVRWPWRWVDWIDLGFIVAEILGGAVLLFYPGRATLETGIAFGFWTVVILELRSIIQDRSPADITLRYTFDEAMDATVRHQLKTDTRVKIVSAHTTYTPRFQEDWVRVLKKQVCVDRIIDLKRWATENVLHHLQVSWSALVSQGQGVDPVYHVKFVVGRTGNLGCVLVREKNGVESASFFQYSGAERECMYFESRLPGVVNASRQYFDHLWGDTDTTYDFPPKDFMDSMGNPDLDKIGAWLGQLQ